MSDLSAVIGKLEDCARTMRRELDSLPRTLTLDRELTDAEVRFIKYEVTSHMEATRKYPHEAFTDRALLSWVSTVRCIGQRLVSGTLPAYTDQKIIDYIKNGAPL